MRFLHGSLAGPGYVILNVIRTMNIIVLLEIIAASIVMLVKISIVNGFFFFEAVTHCATVGISISLIVSELNILRGYFDRNWPLFGQDSGFITLSVVMTLLGVSILGSLNKLSASQDSLGLAFWRIIISAGILSIIMSVINIAATFIFTDREQGVSARHVRSYGAVAPHKVDRVGSQKSFKLGLSRQDSLPTYRSSRSPSSRKGRFPLKISAPIRGNRESLLKSPKQSDIAIPDLAHHPAMMYPETV